MLEITTSCQKINKKSL